MGTKSVMVQTRVDEKFQWLARDMDGSAFVFEDKPSIATDIACDTWDVKTGEILQVTPKVGYDSHSEDFFRWWN